MVSVYSLLVGSTQTWSSLDWTAGEFDGNVRKGVEGNFLSLFLRGTDAFARLGEVSFEVLH